MVVTRVIAPQSFNKDIFVHAEAKKMLERALPKWDVEYKPEFGGYVVALVHGTRMFAVQTLVKAEDLAASSNDKEMVFTIDSIANGLADACVKCMKKYLRNAGEAKDCITKVEAVRDMILEALST